MSKGSQRRKEDFRRVQNNWGDINWHHSVEEDGEEITTPIPTVCQKFGCSQTRLVEKNGFMVCPHCQGSYGQV